MTEAEHIAQRDMVLRSELMQASRSDRRDMPKRKPAVVAVITQHADPTARARVYVLPIVQERLL